MLAEGANAAGGPTTAAERDIMLAGIYDEMRMAAARMIRRKPPSESKLAADIADETALRHQTVDHMTWEDQQAFFATGARNLRDAMIDSVRQRRHQMTSPSDTAKNAQHIESGGYDVEMLDAALIRLESVSPELARLVELRFFVGLSISEIAVLLAQSECTVQRRWKAASLWLAQELQAA